MLPKEKILLLTEENQILVCCVGREAADVQIGAGQGLAATAGQRHWRWGGDGMHDRRSAVPEGRLAAREDRFVHHAHRLSPRPWGLKIKNIL